jgi:DNA repair protein RecO (recombination protein O)
MEWRSTGILLSVRRHGENAAIIETLTPEYGRHAGLVHGGAGRRMAATLQPGNLLSLRWRARLAENLGTFEAELVHSYAAAAMADREALATVETLRAMACAFLPERGVTSLFDLTKLVFDLLPEAPARRVAYSRWEVALLSELGFGLDFGTCAATGEAKELAFVSPRSGRAVSREAGLPYADRLLPLPEFLAEGGAEASAIAFADALTMSGHFLDRWAGQPLGLKALPPARDRLVSLLRRTA